MNSVFDLDFITEELDVVNQSQEFPENLEIYDIFSKFDLEFIPEHHDLTTASISKE
jgi:hypothetical protein